MEKVDGPPYRGNGTTTLTHTGLEPGTGWEVILAEEGS